MAQLNYAQAINQALFEEMERDTAVFLMGECICQGGAPATRGLFEKFGAKRVRDTPISESAFVGAAVGAALCGARPICEVMFASFFYCAFDQLCNQAAKLRYMSDGQARLPITYRTGYGAMGSGGAQHTACVYGQLLNVPGLKLVAPSDPADAKGLLKSAIRDDNPVVFFEHFSLGGAKGEVPEGEHLVPIGRAAVKRRGRDVTVVAIGWMVAKALRVAERLERDGIEVEVVDPRTLAPLDEETILESVARTSRVVVVDESQLRGSAASEIAATIAEKGFDLLDAPVRRVAAFDSPVGFSPVFEKAILPDEARIESAIRDCLA